MSPFQFLKQLSLVPGNSGDGVRVRKVYSPTELTTSAGLTLTAATAPTIGNAETNAIAVIGAASTTALGSFVFVVPNDYDETADELKIVMDIESGGSTDTPTITPTVYKKSIGAALSADLAPSASAAIAAANGEVTVDLSSKGLVAGDVLTINLVSAAHTTDTVILHSVAMQYRSGIVFNDSASR